MIVVVAVVAAMLGAAVGFVTGAALSSQVGEGEPE